MCVCVFVCVCVCAVTHPSSPLLAISVNISDGIVSVEYNHGREGATLASLNALKPIGWEKCQDSRAIFLGF